VGREVAIMNYWKTVPLVSGVESLMSTQAMTKMDELMAGLWETIEHHSRKIRQLQLLTWWQSEQVDGIAMKERSLPERLGLHKVCGWTGDCGG